MQAGFSYHHAEPSYVMLTKWLRSGPSTLPPAGAHQIGVGAFVLDADDRVSRQSLPQSMSFSLSSSKTDHLTRG
jgi:hypothetical protein